MMEDARDRMASAMLAQARAELAGVAPEALGKERNSRFRGRRIIRAGSAWHVGVLLLGPEEAYATAEIVRAAELRRLGFTAESARERAERRDQARRGGFAEGEVVHVGWTPIDVAFVDAGGSSGPLALVDGVVMVRWSAAGGFMPLEAYLRERVALLRSGA